jgi:hypothetical protein
MTPGIFAMLLGAFVVPAIILWAGHRLRRRSPRWRSAFWGAVVGHVAALVIGLIAGLFPAEHWSDTDYWRGALGLWSFLLLPAIGAGVGVLRPRG